MRTNTVLAVVTSLALGASAVACKDNPAPPPPATSASVTPQSSAPAASASASAAASGSAAAADTAGGRGRHGDRGPHARGLSAMFFRGAKDLADLEDAQKTKIDEAQKKVHDGGDAREELKKAGKELHTELAAAVRAGKVEAAKLEPKYAAIEKLMKAQHEKEAEGLNALHAALTAPQRKALVASVQAKHTAMEERMKKREERKDAAGDAGKANHRGQKHIERLTGDLDLDAEQQKKVAALVPPDASGPDRAEMKKKMDAILAAFDKDTFDAKKVDAFDAKRARGPMEQETKLVGQIVPILKPEQREKLAAKMDKGPSPHGRRGGGGFDHNKADDDDDDD